MSYSNYYRTVKLFLLKDPASPEYMIIRNLFRYTYIRKTAGSHLMSCFVKSIVRHQFPDHHSRRFRRNRGCIPDWQCKASCSNRCRSSSKDDKDSAWSDTSCRHSADAVRVPDTACYSGPSDKQSWRAPVQLHYCQVRNSP